MRKQLGVIFLEIKWFPRSWIQIKNDELVIYIDPSYLSSYFKGYGEKIVFSDAEDDCLPENLEKADLILISHIHKDHCKDITINRLSNENTVILTPKAFKKEPDLRVKLVKPNTTYIFGSATINVINAYNTPEGNSTRKVHKKGDCAGYILNMAEKRIYFSGDTDFIPDMECIGSLDLAIIPIGGTFTMDIAEAVKFTLTARPKAVMPVHHLNCDPLIFRAELDGISDVMVLVPQLGQIYEI